MAPTSTLVAAGRYRASGFGGSVGSVTKRVNERIHSRPRIMRWTTGVGVVAKNMPSNILPAEELRHQRTFWRSWLRQQLPGKPDSVYQVFSVKRRAGKAEGLTHQAYGESTRGMENDK